MTVWALGDPDVPDEIREILERLSQPKNDKPLPALRVPPPLPVGSPRLYTMKVTLLDVDPPVWRRFVAPSFMTLEHFHALLQGIMGWRNAHAFAFTINGNRFISGEKNFSVDAMWDREGGYDSENYELCQLIKPGMKFQYVYDFGDGWEHEIVVETDKTNLDTKYCFYCVEGERACPPEDCGGPDGYAYLLEILDDLDHPEHGDKLEWLEWIGYHHGRFDSEKFDPDECNRKLGIRRPGQLVGPKVNKAALDKKKKQERKRKEVAKKRNRK